jgi:hypothetical protein
LTENGSPRLIAMLAGSVPLREPWPSENDFFKRCPHITGMAAEDGMVVLNPYSQLTDKQKDAVALNEAARVFMNRDPTLQPQFALTPEQERAFADYGGPAEIRGTIAARLLSGDPSALSPTQEQAAFVHKLANAMGIDLAPALKVSRDQK